MIESPSPEDATRSFQGQAHAASENLRFAVRDHQEMIRGADLKAEVLGIFLTATFAAVSWEGRISTASTKGWLGIVATITALAAFFCVGCTLWPRSDPWADLMLGNYTPSRVLYPQTQAIPGDTIAENVQRALTTDWPSELTYELRKISRIRLAKQTWFRVALLASGASISAVALRLFVR